MYYLAMSYKHEELILTEGQLSLWASGTLPSIEPSAVRRGRVF